MRLGEFFLYPQFLFLECRDQAAVGGGSAFFGVDAGIQFGMTRFQGIDMG
jgi:hypothetical protein